MEFIADCFIVHDEYYDGDLEFGDDNYVPCVNVGGDPAKGEATWYPADKLTILPSQVVSHVLDGDDAEEMVEYAQIIPPVNKRMITSDGLSLLGLRQKADLDLLLVRIHSGKHSFLGNQWLT